MHDDRGFDPDPGVRRVARELYAETRELPIVSPHGHVDPRLLADDEPFPEPTALIVAPDHYILRMLYSRGIPLERLGIPPRAGGDAERDPRKVWQLVGDHYHLFRGTPTAMWLDYELSRVFRVEKKLEAGTAQAVYDEIREKLAAPEFRPRALFERFNIEVLATTDPAADSLESHRRIRGSGWKGRVIPTFRPDAVLRTGAAGWSAEIEKLAAVHGTPIGDCAGFLRALEKRRGFFRSMGATATDHGVEIPWTEALPGEEAERLFRLALNGKATPADQRRFEAHLLMEMARMSAADGLVMQLHAGALRDHNRPLFERFGPDRGGDIPVATEFTRNLRNLLGAYGNDPRFRLILFTLDESTYARELAPLAGLYPAVRLGAAWWFHDSLEGMRRYRERTTETAGIYNTAGFTDDTRAFCSIPARHDLARRVDANWLAGLVAHHVVEPADARVMARALAYELAKDAYRLAPAGASC
ncbi:MAG TPA: glucuronate isomerase [Gemmatimonadales bacterium]|jgi:glucuronate isomerase|nr:glucuronate isomerase [Gemmatimonadales bacterium]